MNSLYDLSSRFFCLLSFLFSLHLYIGDAAGPAAKDQPCLTVTGAQIAAAGVHIEQVSPTKGYGMRQLPVHFHLSA